MLFEICLHIHMYCTNTHTRTNTVGGGGSASYYQLIFAVLFLLQRVVPYVSLSASAFNLLLASAVKTSYLKCWFDRGTLGRREGERCIVHTVYITCCACKYEFVNLVGPLLHNTADWWADVKLLCTNSEDRKFKIHFYLEIKQIGKAWLMQSFSLCELRLRGNIY